MFASGNHITILDQLYHGGTGQTDNGYMQDGYPVIGDDNIGYAASSRNNYQLSPYHRLDLGIKIYRPKKKGRMGIWTISVYNVYSRMNPFMIYKKDKEVRDPNSSSGYDYIPVFKTVGIMPIIPSVSYTYKF